MLPNALKPNLNYMVGGNGFTNSRLKELKQNPDVDVFAFGSSHTYRGFDPRIFKKHEISLFNMGSSMQTPIQIKTLIKRYITKIAHKKVILEVYPYPFCLDGIESAVDLIANDRNDKHSLSMALDINNIKTYNTLIFGYLNDQFSGKSDFIENPIFENDTYVNGGFVEKKLSYISCTSFNEMSWNYKETQFEVFEEILALLKAQNVEIILVYAPIPKVLYNAVNNQEIFHERMETYGPYYNFNEILQLTDTLHFFDANHLNQIGVELFNEKLIEVLNGDGLLKNK